MTLVPTFTTEDEPFTFRSLITTTVSPSCRMFAVGVVDDANLLHVCRGRLGPLVSAFRADEVIAVFVGVFGVTPEAIG